MKLKSLFYFIINRNCILVLTVMLIFALVCTMQISHSGKDAGLQFIVNYNWYNSTFLVQMPLILCVLVPVYSNLQNELLHIRCLSHLSFFYLKLKAAAMISVMYVLIKAVIEVLFLLFLGGHWLVDIGYTFAAIYLIQLGSLIFVSILLLMLQELLNNNVIAIMIFIFMLGVDLLSCVMPLYTDINLNLFIGPMGLMMQHAIYLTDGNNPVNFIYQYIYMAIKIFLVVLITSLLVRSGRREYLGQKY